MEQGKVISYRDYIATYASETKEGKFFCEACGKWINKQRWLHFKLTHRGILKPKNVKQNISLEEWFL